MRCQIASTRSKQLLVREVLQLRLLSFLDCFLSPPIIQLGTLNDSLLRVWTGSALPSSAPTQESHLMKSFQHVDGCSYLPI
jgi:hypothetical protein